MKQSTKNKPEVEVESDVKNSKAAKTAPLMISLSEAAALMGVHRTTVYNMYRSGEFPVPVVKFGTNLRIVRSHLMLFMATGEPVEKGTRVEDSASIAS